MVNEMSIFSTACGWPTARNKMVEFRSVAAELSQKANWSCLVVDLPRYSYNRFKRRNQMLGAEARRLFLLESETVDRGRPSIDRHAIDRNNHDFASHSQYQFTEVVEHVVHVWAI